jgi:hypothetical protein
MMRILVAFALFIFAGALFAQDEVIILSPFEVAAAGERGSPPITVRKTGDFLLLQIQLMNDTRDPEKRRAELYDTIKAILTVSSAIPKMEVASAEMVLNERNYQVELDDTHGKSDSSSVALYLKLPLAATDDVGGLSNRLRLFAQEIRIVGRTEVFAGEIGISVRNPERFRYEVIGKIAEDVRKMRDLFGDSFEIVVTGLDQRLKWNRSSVSELEFYVPYSYEVFPVRAGKTFSIEKD